MKKKKQDKNEKIVMKMLLFICGIADKIDGGLRKEEKYAEKKRFYFVLALLIKTEQPPD